jgi:hypothetical protein
MDILRQLPAWLRPSEPPAGDEDRLRRRDAMVEAAVALAAEVAEGGLEGVLDQAVRATAEITGAAAVLVLVDGEDLGPVRERLRPFGGDVRVTSAPDAPLVIAFEIPHAVN